MARRQAESRAAADTRDTHTVVEWRIVTISLLTLSIA